MRHVGAFGAALRQEAMAAEARRAQASAIRPSNLCPASLHSPGFSAKTRTRRKPMLPSRLVGGLPFRSADRQSLAF
jgi:hypothetical protein